MGSSACENCGSSKSAWAATASTARYMTFRAPSSSSMVAVLLVGFLFDRGHGMGGAGGGARPSSCHDSATLSSHATAFERAGGKRQRQHGNAGFPGQVRAGESGKQPFDPSRNPNLWRNLNLNLRGGSGMMGEDWNQRLSEDTVKFIDNCEEVQKWRESLPPRTRRIVQEGEESSESLENEVRCFLLPPSPLPALPALPALPPPSSLFPAPISPLLDPPYFPPRRQPQTPQGIPLRGGPNPKPQNGSRLSWHTAGPCCRWTR
jgi:hypothetical protein